jgi:hypothetical protein
MTACRDMGFVLDKLAWMRAEGIWPNGRRYLWTDAFGGVLGRHAPGYTQKGGQIARDIHEAFVVPDRGVWWRMREDLSGPDPHSGFGGLDEFDGYVSYRFLDEDALAPQIADMRPMIEPAMPEFPNGLHRCAGEQTPVKQLARRHAAFRSCVTARRAVVAS